MNSPPSNKCGTIRKVASSYGKLFAVAIWQHMDFVEVGLINKFVSKLVFANLL